MGHSKFLIPAFSLLLLIIFTAGVVRYIQSPDPSPVPQVATNQQTQSSVTAQSSVKADESNTTRDAISSQKDPELVSKQPASKEAQPAQPLIRKRTGPVGNPRPSLTQTQPPATSVEQQITATEKVAPQREVTRGPTPGDAPVSLVDVKRVYVESGEEPSDQILRQMLLRQLQLSERFTLSKTRDEADALFKVTTRLTRSNPGKLRQADSLSLVVLVNSRGEVIWPIKNRSSRGRYLGLSPEQVSAQVLKDLVEDIEDIRR